MFKLSNILPIAWFHKLKDMGRNRRQNPKKKNQPMPTPPVAEESPLSDDLRAEDLESEFFSIDLSHPTPEYVRSDSIDAPRKLTKYRRSTMLRNRPSNANSDDAFELDLARVSTQGNASCSTGSSPVRRSSSSSVGVSLRSDSTGMRRIQSRRIGRKRELAEDVAVGQPSVDPQRDFMESMLEMVEKHKLRGSMDMEQLLGTYVALNPEEFHELIHKVFDQINLKVK